tara:strand:- start:263 stop:538 length:276 start_codon:yes stop_codon:yes gene_type:complete
MSDYLSKEQKDQLQKMVNDMLDVASNVIEEYKSIEGSTDLDLDELISLSGSITQIHEDSPFLDEMLKGDSWKRVIKHIPPQPKINKEDNDS